MSDNLPPGSPLEYFDLCEPHPRYRIEKLKQYEKLVEECNNPAPNTRFDHTDISATALEKIGLNYLGVNVKR
jgi:hypothetical protein